MDIGSPIDPEQKAQLEDEILGLILRDGAQALELFRHVYVEDFGSPGRRDVLSAARQLWALRRPISVASVSSFLSPKQLGNVSYGTKATGAAALDALANAAPASDKVDVTFLGDHLVELSRRYALHYAAATFTRRLANGESEDLATRDFEAEIARIKRRDRGEHDGAEHFATLIEPELETMRRRAEGEEAPLVTPWESVNKAFRGGIWPGLHVLVSASGMGKTQWAMQVAVAAAEAGHPVVYAGLELGRLDVVMRVLGIVSGRPWSDLMFGKDAFAKTAHASEEHKKKLRELPLYIDIAPPFGWKTSRLELLARRHKPKLLVLDYVQLIAPESEREDARRTIGRAAYAARAVARDYGCAVLAISSTARANYVNVDGAEGDPKKKLGHGDPARLIGLGKESGELEFASDTVLVLGHEPRAEGEEEKAERTSWLAVAKGRGIPTSWTELRFDRRGFSDPNAPLPAKLNPEFEDMKKRLGLG